MKKGSLQLSINAIVILILAITMLGLGLGFMRSVFTSATEEFTRVGGTVQKQMIDQMKQSDKVVDLDRTKVEIKRAKGDQIFIGLRNVQATAQYFEIQAPDLTQLGSAAAPNEICIDNLVTSRVGLGYKATPTLIESGEVVVLPINVDVKSNGIEGTCFVDFEICSDSDTVTMCADGESRHVELTVNVLI